MKIYMMLYPFIAALLLAMACGQEPENLGPKYQAADSKRDSQPRYRFAVHPLHNPAKLMQQYQPLLDYLNSKLTNAELGLEASRDYADYESKIMQGRPDILLPNPWQTLQAMDKGYEVIAMAGDPDDFKGVFIIRNDSPIRDPLDLKGKSVSYPAPTALAACVMPQYYLHEHGIDINTDIENQYVGSQESAIMNAYIGKTAAAATWPPPWREFHKDHPEEAKQLKLIWETKPLINNSVMVRKDIPGVLKQQLRIHLIALKNTDEGRSILQRMETTAFYKADDATYDVIRQYVARFEQEVRKIN